MKEEIIKHLKELEKKENIKILMAVESGSRAWGCPSPDSDYDVRIVFIRPQQDYLGIFEKTDSLDYFHGELLDINGWDIKKTFKLVMKSNVTPFEWAQSPIVYFQTEGFTQRLLALSQKYFHAKHAINHYRGIAKNSFIKGHIDGQIKLKKLFYVLRPLMAAVWIIKKKALPPMDIPRLLPIIENQDIVAKIKELLALKETVNEDYTHNLSSEMKTFIEAEFDFVNHAQLEDTPYEDDPQSLNKAFQSLLKTAT